MSRHLFGWSYPPGAANDPNAPWNQQEGPCDVCLNFVDDCVCPECKVCKVNGNPECYDHACLRIPFSYNGHGMEMTDEQMKERTRNEKLQADALQAEVDARIDEKDYE